METPDTEKPPEPKSELSKKDQKRIREATEKEEIYTEGRQHRMAFRTNPHGE